MAFMVTSIRKARLSEWAGLLLLIFAVASAALICVMAQRFLWINDNHLTLLAEQFSHLNLSYGINHPTGDIVDYFATFYSYFGPLSSVVLVPFVTIFGPNFPQNAVGIISLLASFILVYRIADKCKYKETDRLWWALFFCFSTVMAFVSLINISAYQVQSLGTVFLLLAMDEYLGKKRYWLIGLWVACAGAVRLTLFLTLLFFIFDWWRSKAKTKQMLIQLLVPVVIFAGLVGIYNWRRFGVPWESGYAFNVTLNYYPMNANYAKGFFSLSHVPANIYNLLLRGPDPIFSSGGGFVLQFPYLKVDPWGLSVFITSPLLLLIFRIKKWKTLWPYWATVLIILVPMLLYFGIGFSQFGYRYFLDAWPLVLIILMKGLQPKLDPLAKFLIVVGVVFNMVFMMSLWNFYPQFFAEINPSAQVIFGSDWPTALSGKYR